MKVKINVFRIGRVFVNSPLIRSFILPYLLYVAKYNEIPENVSGLEEYALVRADVDKFEKESNSNDAVGWSFETMLGLPVQR